MKFKDILAIVTSAARDESVFAFAEQLASQSSGRVTSLLIGWLPNVVPVEPWIIESTYDALVQTAKADFAKEAARVKARIARLGESAAVESKLVEFGAARFEIGMHVRHVDVAIVRRPTTETWDSARNVLEGSLFDSGRPVIAVPPDWKRRPVGKSVLIAWKPTREAARAMAEADDLLAGANRVSLVTVDAKPSEDSYGPQPGADIATHLAKRNVRVELFNLDSGGRSETRAILDQALAVDADLIVMGGYGRSRLSESIFGGVTREILLASDIPLLLSH